MSDIEIVTKSRLASYALCQRLHDYQYNLGYRLLLPRELADFGSVMHAGLDAWWKAHQDGGLLALTEALGAMKRYKFAAAALSPDMSAKAEILMAAYDARWAPTMVEWEVLGVEVEFVVVLPGRKRLRIAGKLDKLLRRRSDGTVWFGEHKTTGSDLSLGSDYWQRLRLDPQVSIYHLGVRELGYEPAGCLYDVIARPAQRLLKATPVELRKYTKPTKKEPESRLYANQRETDETIDEFRARLGGMIMEQPEAYFARSEVVRLESEIEASLADVTEAALQIRSGSQTGISPRNPAACHHFGQACEFFDVCSGTADIADGTRFVRLDNKHPELAGIASI